MQNLGKPFYILTLGVILSLFLSITPTQSDGPDIDQTTVEYISPETSEFYKTWDSMPDGEKQKVHEKAIWVARVLLSEDKREEPWVMMASIIINREKMGFRGKKTIWGVIHDKHQFSAVGGPHWDRYKQLTLNSRNQNFARAYEIARKILVMGVPERYKGVTHAYYPETMMAVYGYDRDYPAWDTPNNPMGKRDEVDGWIYGAP